MSETVSTAYVVLTHVAGAMERNGISFDAAQAEFNDWLNSVKAEAWEEGCYAFEYAHNLDNLEPWGYLESNPYRVKEEA